MKPLSRDTHPEAEKVLIEGYRRMTPGQKLAKVRALNQMAQRLQLADLRERYPRADENELRLRLASRWLPAELMRKAFSWDPDQEGY
jgi:hypothetical protein